MTAFDDLILGSMQGHFTNISEVADAILRPVAKAFKQNPAGTDQSFSVRLGGFDSKVIFSASYLPYNPLHPLVVECTSGDILYWAIHGNLVHGVSSVMYNTLAEHQPKACSTILRSARDIEPIVNMGFSTKALTIDDYYGKAEEACFSELIGEEIVSVDFKACLLSGVVSPGTYAHQSNHEDLVDSDYIIFETKDHYFFMLHSYECCEGVHIKDICGDLKDLVGQKITGAHMATNIDENEENQWTFYRIETPQLPFVISWHGESNGYYSMEVSFKKVAKEK